MYAMHVTHALRLRSIVAIALLLSGMLPAVLPAQRIPFGIFGGRRPPGGPTQLPPQPAAIARELAYQRLRLSVESYPMVAYFNAPGLFGGAAVSRWSSFGMGTRADYRITRTMSATFDVTDTFLRGPANTATAELGMRFHPERNDRRVYPFVDVRAGYVAAYSVQNQVYGVYAPPNGPIGYGAPYSEGYGAVAGVGGEVVLSRSFSLTTAASVLRGAMRTYNTGAYAAPLTASLTSVRYTLGLRYNPVRIIRANDLQ